MGFKIAFNGKPTTETHAITPGVTSTPANSKVVTGITINQLKKLDIDTSSVRTIIDLTFFLYLALADFPDF